MNEEPHEGSKAEKQVFNKEVSLNCVACGHSNVIWVERILLEGSLEMYYVVHTEVNDVYECPACKHRWEISAIM